MDITNANLIAVFIEKVVLYIQKGHCPNGGGRARGRHGARARAQPAHGARRRAARRHAGQDPRQAGTGAHILDNNTIQTENWLIFLR